MNIKYIKAPIRFDATYRIAPSERIAESCADKDTGERYRSEKQLPFSGLFNIAVFYNAGDDGSREDTVRESNL